MNNPKATKVHSAGNLTDEEIGVLADQVSALRTLATGIGDETRAQEETINNVHRNAGQLVGDLAIASVRTISLLKQHIGPKGFFIVSVMFFLVFMIKIINWMI